MAGDGSRGSDANDAIPDRMPGMVHRPAPAQAEVVALTAPYLCRSDLLHRRSIASRVPPPLRYRIGGAAAANIETAARIRTAAAAVDAQCALYIRLQHAMSSQAILFPTFNSKILSVA